MKPAVPWAIRGPDVWVWGGSEQNDPELQIRTTYNSPAPGPWKSPKLRMNFFVLFLFLFAFQLWWPLPGPLEAKVAFDQGGGRGGT